MYIINLKMKKNTSISFIVFLIILLTMTNVIFARSIIKNKIFYNNIKTVKIFREGSNISYPILMLNSNQKINLIFDEISENANEFSYKIIHCTPNWEVSDLSEQDYLNGFFENTISDYKFSFNTLLSYTHYKLSIPNENIRITKSGNYAIIVYKDLDASDTVLVSRFYVAENNCSINAKITKPNIVDKMKSDQKINFSIESNIKIKNPFEEIKVIILQNNIWQTAKTNLKPQYVKDKTLEYNDDIENLFDAGNEFRYFNTKNLKLRTENIKEISYKKPYYNIYLFNDKKRNFKKYFFEKDLNGKFTPDMRFGEDPNLDADYCYVYFSLNYPTQLLDDDIYVFGELTNYETSANNKMTYNFKTHSYEAKLLLKQGIYNYNYVAKSKKTGKLDFGLIEGNHFETENDYLFFVYYKGFGDNFYRILGYNITNTLNQKQ